MGHVDELVCDDFTMLVRLLSRKGRFDFTLEELKPSAVGPE